MKVEFQHPLLCPVIMSWPDGIKDPGRFEDVPSHLIDVPDAKYPTEFNGNEIKPMRGLSLAPLFQGKRVDKQHAIYGEHEKHAGIRSGDWKLVTLDVKEEDSWELYNLRNDRTETSNLIYAHPEKAKEMRAKWEEWAKSANVIPWREKGTANPIDK